MKLNARKFATWIIAMVIVTLLYQLAGDGEEMLASGFGVGVLVIGMVFRRAIFGALHGGVERVIDTQAEKLFAVREDDGQPFDADAAFANYMANRESADELAAELGTVAPPPRGFGRKGL